ncbi:WXG100 family type VII secretion target [Nocardia huaxiensis]|uniref:WXG100 family type VII secretion target n=1 Tax=Nocardia huaxiensis TaxID=2755382 RepID=UPI001E5EC0FF|nr:WXG100 family type VII secretion target [Nocardia huaxiensis]UFS99126.1 WXG100 family type VII secretion target [Nocardia huaxiensis]
MGVTDGGSPADSAIAVVPEEVRQVGNFVYGIADELKSALDSAAGDVTKLLEGGWTGGAATEFADGWNDIRDGGSQIIAALTGMAEKLGVTADSYQQLDEARAAALGGSSLDLP